MDLPCLADPAGRGFARLARADECPEGRFDRPLEPATAQLTPRPQAPAATKAKAWLRDDVETGRRKAICSGCEHQHGFEMRHGRDHVRCDACITCGPKMISLAIQACPLGKFTGVLTMAENVSSTQNISAEDVAINERRRKFLEERNKVMRMIKMPETTEADIDTHEARHLWPKSHVIGSVRRLAIGRNGHVPRPPTAPAAAQTNGLPKMADGGSELVGEQDWVHYFDRVHVISLRSNPGRLQTFWDRWPQDWPFKRPEAFLAVHGDQMGVPGGWSHGGGAWGCLLSHRRLLEDAVRDGLRRVLILEDDAEFERAAEIPNWLAKVPADWEQVMLGAQRMGDGQWREISPGVHQVTQCERTHAYALQGEAIRSLWLWWCRVGINAHCDWAMGDWQAAGAGQTTRRVYVPTRWFAAQGANMSAISGRNEPERRWEGTGGGVKREGRREVRIGRAFIHCAEMGQWEAILAEIMETLAVSQMPVTGLTIGVVGRAAAVERAAQIARRLDGVAVEAAHVGQLSDYEVPTLRMLWNYCSRAAPGEVVCYLHTKGASYDNDAGRRRWRRSMLDHVVLRWREGIKAVAAGSDVWGGSVADNRRWGFPLHVAGNFWLASCGHLARLPDPEDFAARPNDGAFGFPWRRFSAEMWCAEMGAKIAASLPPNLAWWDNESFTKESDRRIGDIVASTSPAGER